MEAARYAIPRSVGEGLLVAGISASGETARTIEAIRLAKEVGAQTLGITADPESTLASLVNSVLVLNLPEYPEGPGLISYLAALMAGYAIGAHLAETSLQEQIDNFLMGLPEALSEWVEGESSSGQDAAQNTDPTQPILFLGSGPVRGAAMFAAAKVIEAAGQSASSQDVEEWAHLDYFGDPSGLPIWLLSAGGRALGRELEIEEAAAQIGRTLILSKWSYGSESLREVLSPLALWVGPVAYSDSMMIRLGEEPFRGFSGGRDRAEGGGISRIRSSAQLHSLKDLSNTNATS
jgi:glucosamine--fructose-6-phosphate aminotransferase (isomerizing)